MRAAVPQRVDGRDEVLTLGIRGLVVDNPLLQGDDLERIEVMVPFAI